MDEYSPDLRDKIQQNADAFRKSMLKKTNSTAKLNPNPPHSIHPSLRQTSFAVTFPTGESKGMPDFSQSIKCTKRDVAMLQNMTNEDLLKLDPISLASLRSRNTRAQKQFDSILQNPAIVDNVLKSMNHLVIAATVDNPKMKKVEGYINMMRFYQGDLFTATALILCLGISALLNYKTGVTQVKTVLDVFPDKFTDIESEKISRITSKMNRVNAFGVSCQKHPITLNMILSIPDRKDRAHLLLAFAAAFRKTEALQVSACPHEQQHIPCVHFKEQNIDGTKSFLIDLALSDVKRREILHTRIACTCSRFPELCLHHYLPELSQIKKGDLSIADIITRQKKSNPLFKGVDISTHGVRIAFSQHHFSIASLQLEHLKLQLNSQSLLLVQYHARWSTEEMLVHYAKAMARNATSIIPVSYIGAASVSTATAQYDTKSTSSSSSHVPPPQHIDVNKIIQQCKTELANSSQSHFQEEQSQRHSELLEMIKSLRTSKADSAVLNTLAEQIKTIQTNITAAENAKSLTEFDLAQWVECDFCQNSRLILGSDSEMIHNLVSKIGDFSISCLSMSADCATKCDYHEANRKKPRAINWSCLANELNMDRNEIFRIINDSNYRTS